MVELAQLEIVSLKSTGLGYVARCIDVDGNNDWL